MNYYNKNINNQKKFLLMILFPESQKVCDLN